MTTYFTYDQLMYNGRLGNQLWQIAATIGIAAKNGGLARFNPEWEYRPYFNVPDEFFEPIPEGAERIDGGTNYFQQLHWWSQIEDEIRGYFTPTGVRFQEALDRFGHLKNYADRTWVAIHVRRGDYLNHPDLFPQPTAHYFETAKRMVSQDPDRMFLIFSDDIPWCADNLAHLGLDDYNDRIWLMHGTTRPVEVADRIGEPSDQWDMFVMAMCNDHVISNSTFSWWGAFLSPNEEVIYPSNWFGRGIPEYDIWELAMPAEWRKVKC